MHLKGLSLKIVAIIVVVIIIAGIAAWWYMTQQPTGGGGAEEEKPREVVIYSQWGGVEGENFQNALKIFENKTGIKVRIVQQSDIRSAIQTELAAGAPQFDVAIVPWPSFVRELGQAGRLMDLTPIYNELDLRNNIINPQSYADVVSVNGKYYAVPIKAWAKPGIWYNVHVFQQLNITVPESGIMTWDEFLNVCEKIKNAGIQPLAAGGQDKWPLTDFTEAVILRMGGPDLQYKLMHHEISWTDPQVEEVFATIADLIKKGYFGSTPTAEAWSQQIGRLANGEVAMYFMGNWLNLMIQSDYNKKPGVDYDLMLFPRISEDVSIAIVAGGDWAIVPANPPHPDEARELVKWLAGPEYQEAMVKMKGYLAVHKGVPKSAYDAVDAKIVDWLNQYTVVPDLDDNFDYSEFQLTFWNALYNLWSNPDNYQQILQQLEQEAESLWGSGG